jgi:predicted dehydrogenase
VIFEVGMVLRVGIVGAGLQGWRRAPAIAESPETEVSIVTALHLAHAERLARRIGCRAGTGWHGVVEADDVDAVVVCTPPDSHKEISIAAMRNGKHVLCEKPLARTVADAEEMVSAAARQGVVLKCGFNHRHHPGLEQAHQRMAEGFLGEIDYLRCRYGICGRPGFEREWRADPKVAAGGQLMEQGVHALDLFRWFAGDFVEAAGFVDTRYWATAPLDDNAMGLLRTSRGAVAYLHSSLTHWRNLFSFEVFGHDGYAVVEGLGGAYGTETVRFGRRAFDRPFEEQQIEYRGQDPSWKREWQEFADAVREGRRPIGDGRDGVEAMRMALAIYEASRTCTVVQIRSFAPSTRAGG